MEKVVQFQSLTQGHYLINKEEFASPKEPIYILLHGFMSTPQKMWERFADRLPEESIVLAPAGPFPLPQREDKSWKVGYSWFFYDNFKDEYFVDYDICQDYIKNLLRKLGLHDHPKTIIGFSQGGYSAVHMAEVLTNVQHVIGMGCRFKIKDPKFSENLVVEAVHGELDDIVEVQGAIESFKNIPENNRGRFKSFKEARHKPTEEMIKTVVQWCESLEK